jgi:hypothetical protein
MRPSAVLILFFCPGIKRREGYKEVPLIMRKLIAVLAITMAVVGMAGA